MCGVCGIYNWRDGDPIDRQLLARMTGLMTHRGPDDDGFLVDGAVGLGMRRLSIIDLEGGAQPIANESGTVSVLMNGEIYNFVALRTELERRGHVFRTQSDTEVVVHAYEEWGLAALDRLNGMFGVCIWDAPRRRLAIARDPFGVKPLYLWQEDGRLVFGSELSPILCHPDVARRVDTTALRQLLRFTYVPGSRTAFAGVEKLLPGHVLVCSPAGTERRRFVTQRPRTRRDMPRDEAVSDLRRLIERAVERQMVADVPVGVMLSGGVDSMTIATVMTRLRGAPIDTFTVGFEGDFAQNEIERARQAAATIGSRHHEVLISAREYAEFLPRSIRAMEEPVATAQTFPFFRLCESARRHVKVVLTGQGADEPFAGYPRHLGERYGRFYRALPRPLRHHVVQPLVDALPRNERLKRATLSLTVDDPLERMLAVYSVVDPELEQQLMPAADDERAEAFGIWQQDVADLDDLNKMLYVDARTSLADNLLLYGDKMAMAVSLEARVPFLDLELMDLAECLPASMKITGRRQKAVLKDAMSAWLPPQATEQKKIGFETPIDSWLRRELREHVRERLLDVNSGCYGYFEPAALERVIDDHVRGRHDHKRLLFTLLTFEIWYDQFIRPQSWA